jgi:hypothetical protein
MVAAGREREMGRQQHQGDGEQPSNSSGFNRFLSTRATALPALTFILLLELSCQVTLHKSGLACSKDERAQQQ